MSSWLNSECIAAYGVAQQALIGRLLALRVVACDQFDRLAAHLLAVALDQCPLADDDFGTESQAKVVATASPSLASKIASGGPLRVTITSVAVMGRHLPARM